MPVTQPNITINLSINTGCTGLSLTDNTGTYDPVTNTGGYGLPGGPAISDITGLSVVLTYNTLSNNITYTFILVSGVITDATLSIAGGTPVDIQTQLPSTVWPFILPFNLTGSYGVTIPTFADDVFSVAYTITGTVSATPFSFEAIRNQTVSCQTQCCIDKKWAALDLICDCNGDKMQRAFYGQALLNQANTASTKFGDLANSIIALNQAKALCPTTDCGC